MSGENERHHIGARDLAKRHKKGGQSELKNSKESESVQLERIKDRCREKKKKKKRQSKLVGIKKKARSRKQKRGTCVAHLGKEQGTADGQGSVLKMNKNTGGRGWCGVGGFGIQLQPEKSSAATRTKKGTILKKEPKFHWERGFCSNKQKKLARVKKTKNQKAEGGRERESWLKITTRGQKQKKSVVHEGVAGKRC